MMKAIRLLLCATWVATAGVLLAATDDDPAAPDSTRQSDDTSELEIPPEPKGFALVENEKLGLKAYKQYCQKCHGKRGDGKGLMAKDLEVKPRDFTDAARMRQRSDWLIYLEIRDGGEALGLSDKMTPWADTLTDEEIHAVAAHIRRFAESEKAEEANE